MRVEKGNKRKGPQRQLAQAQIRGQVSRRVLIAAENTAQNMQQAKADQHSV